MCRCLDGFTQLDTNQNCTIVVVGLACGKLKSMQITRFGIYCYMQRAGPKQAYRQKIAFSPSSISERERLPLFINMSVDSAKLEQHIATRSYIEG